MNFGGDLMPYKASLILTSTRFGDLASRAYSCSQCGPEILL